MQSKCILSTSRTPEIGVGVALGARPGAIVGMVLRHSLWRSGIGIVVGVLLALAAVQSIRPLLAGVSGHDPIAMAAAVALVAVSTPAGSLLPVLRALRVNPQTTIRTE